MLTSRIVFSVFALMLADAAHAAEAVRVAVLVPLTGFLSLEGMSQRNGAVLALRHPPPGVSVTFDVQDTGVSPEGAVNALERALAQERPVFVVAPMLGTQMLAMLPIAAARETPLLTVSGTTQITEMDNPWVFRFFPDDSVVKIAHARYVDEILGSKRPAIVYQTTAYGQSGRKSLADTFASLGTKPVLEEGLTPTVRDFTAVLIKIRQAEADSVVLHLHAGPTALFIRQAKAQGLELPIVTGSAMHQPVTAALLSPAELKGVCAETGSSPISGGTPEMTRFAEDYRRAFGSEPDAYALGQYDAVRMALAALADGAANPAALRAALAGGTYRGVATTYKSDGRGNMAHQAMIICYDGASRVPRIVQRY